MHDKFHPLAGDGRGVTGSGEQLLPSKATDIIELRHLRYFLAVARAKSFTGAAEQLRISQPTLSHQIRQLEERFGTRLFQRFPRHAELTPAGEAFKPYCDRLLNELFDGITAVAELEGLVRGSLRIAVFHSFSSSLLGPVLADFALRYPGVHVVARLLPRVEMERELLAGNLDFAVAYASDDTEHITAETLFEEELVLIVGRRHSFARRATIPMRALAELPLVLLTEEFGARQFIDRFFAREGLKPRVVVEMNAIEPILSTIRQAPLATVLAPGVIANRTDLHAVRLTGPTPRRSCAILWRRAGYRTVAANRMAEMIRAAYRRTAKRRGEAQAG
jgi:LysR family cyn operon transcriptional activator